MKRALALILIAIGLLAVGIWREARGNDPQQAFETLSRSKLTVNTAFELEEVEPLADGLSDRLGIIYASYRGPERFDVLKIEVYESEPAAEDRWQDYLASSDEIRTELSTRQPRYGKQVCTLKNQTIKCAVRMYEAVIESAAGGTHNVFDEEAVKANAQVLLMAGVKHWLLARGLGLPDDQVM